MRTRGWREKPRNVWPPSSVHDAMNRTCRHIGFERVGGPAGRFGTSLIALAIAAAGVGCTSHASASQTKSQTTPTSVAPVVPVSAQKPPTKPMTVEIVGLDGKVRRRFKGLHSAAWQIKLSPDGRTMVFSSYLGDHFPARSSVSTDITTRSIDRRSWHSIWWSEGKWEPQGAESIAWAPDGAWLAFDAKASRPGNDYGIDIVRSVGGEGYRVVYGRHATHPSWSPDGKSLAYVLAGHFRVIYTISVLADKLGDLVRGVPRRVVAIGTRLRIARGDWPVFSPDGSLIAFVDPAGRIAIVGSDGTGPRRVLTGRSHPAALAWSPDGTKIAFLSGSCGSDGRGRGVSVVSLVTGAVTQVVACHPGGAGGGPSWLPSSAALLVGGDG
jgi:Tol biopolymer transport system component